MSVKHNEKGRRREKFWLAFIKTFFLYIFFFNGNFFNFPLCRFAKTDNYIFFKAMTYNMQPQEYSWIDRIMNSAICKKEVREKVSYECASLLWKLIFSSLFSFCCCCEAKKKRETLLNEYFFTLYRNLIFNVVTSKWNLKNFEAAQSVRDERKKERNKRIEHRQAFLLWKLFVYGTLLNDEEYSSSNSSIS